MQDLTDLIACPGCDWSTEATPTVYERWEPCPDCGLPGDVLRLLVGWKELMIRHPGRTRLETPILRGDVGHMRVVVDETPAVAVHLAPEPTDEELDLILSPAEARLWADQLREMATLAQRAGWTDDLIERVRAEHMPDARDGQVVAVLDRLTAYMGGSPLGIGGDELSPEAVRLLTAGTGQ